MAASRLGFSFTTNVATTNADPNMIKLARGFVAEPVSYMHLELPMSGNEDAASKLLSTQWEPKSTAPSHYKTGAQYQRCPAVWVDSFCFLYTQGMEEPVLLLGRWTKEVNVMGKTQKLDGLVVAAGGHYERSGVRPPGVEAGDSSLRIRAHAYT